MPAFAVQTNGRGEKPNREVFDSLVRTRNPIATAGWSYRDDLDLRKLERARAKGRLKGKAKDAWATHPFYDAVAKGDLLFYRNLPAPGRFTVVKVTGDYGYLKNSPTGFRSFRPCRLIHEDVLLSNPAVGNALRRYLKLPRRIFQIKTGLAEEFLERFGGGANHRSGGNTAQKLKTRIKRAAADLSILKKKFSYTVGRQEREVNRFHLEYQERLGKFLQTKKLAPEFEKNFIDVDFSSGSDRFIGEVKVTNWLSIGEAFRIALGQILDYGSAPVGKKAEPIIFLDQEVPESYRIELATRLGISVVAERARGTYTLQNPGVNKELAAIFAQ